MIVELCFGNGKPYQKTEICKGITAEELYMKYKKNIEFPCYAIKIDNLVSPLIEKINKPCKIQFLDIRDKLTNLAYQRSLILLFLKAANDLLGKEVSFEVQASLNEGLFIQTVNGDIDEDTIAKIYAQMKKIADNDITIEVKAFNRKEAQKILNAEGKKEKARILKGLAEDKSVKIYSIGDYSDFFYNFLVPSTGYLIRFELMKYRDGMLLRFPQPDNPNDIPDFVDEYIIYNALKEQMKWNNLMGVKYMADLNEKISSNECRNMILLSEALHDKKIVEIADEIVKKKKRIILILGPSSSGKTTFAQRLKIQLMVNGLKPLYIGTDDYFLEREEAEKDENGEYKFEEVEAIDLPLFNRQINSLLNGEKVDMPVFNFLTGHKMYGQKITKLEKNQPIIIEGIHAFNPKLTGEINNEEKFKIYISPLTQINLDAHNRVPTTDIRIIRRMIRDYRSRGYSASATLKMWKKVHEAESRNIFPYSGEADVYFNTVHVYELAVLKKYAEPLLEAIDREDSEYSESRRLLKLFSFIDDIKDEKIIAGDSIIREFIGGSLFSD